MPVGQPQVVVLPHEFVMFPHMPVVHRGRGQTHWLLLQFSPVPQPPHETVREAPQRSVTVIEPHSALLAAQSCALVSGTHTQEFPEHICVPGVQVFRHEVVLPQALETEPHATPLHEGEGQTQLPELQLSPEPQPPQLLTVRGIPQLSVPDVLPHSRLLALQNEASL